MTKREDTGDRPNPTGLRVSTSPSAEAALDEPVQPRDLACMLGVALVLLLVTGGMTGGMLVGLIFFLGFTLALAGAALAALFFTTRTLVRGVRRGLGYPPRLRSNQVDRRAGTLSLTDASDGDLSEVGPLD